MENNKMELHLNMYSEMNEKNELIKAWLTCEKYDKFKFIYFSIIDDDENYNNSINELIDISIKEDKSKEVKLIIKDIDIWKKKGIFNHISEAKALVEIINKIEIEINKIIVHWNENIIQIK